MNDREVAERRESALAGGDTVIDFERRRSPPRKRPPTIQRSNLPSIRIDDRQHRDVVDDANAAIVLHNSPPTIFVRGQALSRVYGDADGHTVIGQHTPDSMRLILSQNANWIELRGAGSPKERVVQVTPPDAVARSVLSQGEWSNVPTLAGITKTPILHSDGSINDQSGYDSTSQLWYAAPKGFALTPVPECPTHEDIAAAISLIGDVFSDFPATTEADRAAILAAVLTATLRSFIDGPCPLFIIDKPRAGTGASLIAEVCAVIATGANARMKTLAKDRDGEETRKAITAFLMAGDTFVVFDNVDAAIESGHLAAVITARWWDDRILGRSEMVHLPVQVTWLATGNNVRVRGDIARRSVVCRLDAKIDKPWERAGFRHPDLLGYVQDRRGEFVAAVFTLARAWLQAGKPRYEAPVLGSFEAWQHVIGGILYIAGVNGFLANLSAFYAAADEDANEWTAFLDVLCNVSRGEPFLVAALAKQLSGDSASVLAEALPANIAAMVGKPMFQRTLGRELSKKEDARYSGLRLIRTGKAHSAVRWQVVTDDYAGELGSLGS